MRLILSVLVLAVAFATAELVSPPAPAALKLSGTAAEMAALSPEIPHGHVTDQVAPAADNTLELVQESAQEMADATERLQAVLKEQLDEEQKTVRALGRALGFQSGAILDQQITASSAHGNNWYYYGPRNARLNVYQNYNGWISNVPNTQTEWIMVDLERLTPIGAVATQGCNAWHWVREYRVEHSQDGTTWKSYTEHNNGEGFKVFAGNYDANAVVTHRFQKPFLARYVRITVLAMANSWPCMRMELYADPNEEWAGGQSLGITDGTIGNDAMTASSAHGNNWVYYGPQHARLYGGGPWGGWIPQFNRAGEWVQVDLGSLKEVGAVATQGWRDGGYYLQTYFISHSRDGQTWTAYTEGGLRRLFDGNVDHWNVVKNVFHEPFMARYVRVIVNDFPGWPVLRMELFAPEHKKFRLGVPLGISTSKISDSALTASTAHGNNWNYYGPRNARLFGGNDYGSFIPNFARNGEWVQVDLGNLIEVGGVATQGRKWGGCWWKKFNLLYSTNGNNWNYYMVSGKVADLIANVDGNSVRSHVFPTSFVARYVRLVVTDFDNWPCMRFEVYGPHPSRMNQGKLETIGEPMGMESGDIKDSQIQASTMYPTDTDACHPRNGRLKSNRGAGAWCSKTNDADQWYQIETDGTIEIGGIATQGRNPDSEEYKDAKQWVTSYRVQFSQDTKEWKTVQTSDGFDQVFRGNNDPNTIVKNAFEKPISAKFIRVLPDGWFGHISMRLEIYDTAARQQRLAEDLQKKKEAEAAEAAAKKAALEAKLKAEQEAREKAEAEEKAAKEKAEDDLKKAQADKAKAASAAEKKVADEAIAAANQQIKLITNKFAELDAKMDANRVAEENALKALDEQVEALNNQVETEKFDENQYRETQKEIADTETLIAEEETKKIRNQVAWGEAEAKNDQEKKKEEILMKRLDEIEKEITTEKKKIDEDDAATNAVANQESIKQSMAIPSSSGSAAASSGAAAGIP